MVNWLHSLSIVPLLLVTCAAGALVTVAIYVIVTLWPRPASVTP